MAVLGWGLNRGTVIFTYVALVHPENLSAANKQSGEHIY